MQVEVLEQAAQEEVIQSDLWITDGPTKVCSACRKDLPLNSFRLCRPTMKNRARSPFRTSSCKACERQRLTAWANKIGPDGRTNLQNKSRRQKLKRSYGISTATLLEMIETQQGLCAICGKPETKQEHGRTRSLSVDHDHRTGKIRELLCASCNLLIGKVDDNIEILQAAVDYLKRHLPTG